MIAAHPSGLARKPHARSSTRFRRAPAPRTFPTVCPVFSLDRIWIHPGELLVDVVVHRSVRARHASDHYPLVARMRATPATGTLLAR